MDDLVEGSPRIEGLRRDLMRTPDEVAAMVRLKGLGWGDAADRGGAGVQPGDGAALRGRAACVELPGAAAAEARWMGARTGWRSGFAATAATPTWCARNWRASMA